MSEGDNIEEIEGEEEEEKEEEVKESRIYISPCLKSGEVWPGVVYENRLTITSTLENAVKLYPDNEVYGVRTSDKGDFDFMTYESLWNTLQVIAKGLKSELRNTKAQTRIGIILETSREWSLMEHSSFMLNFVVVGIPTNTGPFSMIKMINENEMEVVVIDYLQFELMKDISKACPTLKTVIVVGITPENEKKENDTSNLSFRILPFDFLLSKYSDDFEDFEIEWPQPDDICLQIYTSGSTGDSKGVQLCHRSVVHAVAALIDNNEGYTFHTTLNYVSFLPLSHLNEQTGHHVFLFIGSKIAFGSLSTLMSREDDGFVGDLCAINPVIFSGVPRVWETMRKAIEYSVSEYSFVWRWAFQHFLEKRLKSLKAGKNEEFYFEKYVFGKIRKKFGSRIQILVSGSSPLAEETQYFIQAVMGNKIIFSQCYGISETVAGITLQNTVKFDGTLNVGSVLKGTEIKLVSHPDLNYHTHDKNGDEKLKPEGEIYVRTPQLFRGYYRKPEITKASITDDGWYKSGDIGRFTEDGKLQIIDRVKNVVKIGNGEFVAVEAMESRYMTSAFIRPNGICVIPNGYKSFVCAVALLDPKYALNFINKNFSKEFKDLDSALEEFMDQLKVIVLADLRRIARKNSRPIYEFIVDITLYNEEWSPMNGLTSMAYKLFRRKIAKKYRSDLDRMYGIEGGESGRKKEIENMEKSLLKIKELFPGITDPKKVEIVLQLCKMMDRSIFDIDFSKPVQAVGIDSLTTVLLMNTLKKTTGKSIKVSHLVTLSLGKILKKLYSGEIEGEEEEEESDIFEDYEEFVDLQKEITKLENVISEISRNYPKLEEKEEKESEEIITGVFVTGASGFLGVQIINELLDQFEDENVKFYCLIRSRSIDRFLSKFSQQEKKRLVVIPGDLSKPYFGYPSEPAMMNTILYDENSNIKRFQVILHGGSLVNHFFGYDDLYDTNVSSFFDILRLSMLRIPIHLISSTVTYLDLCRDASMEEVFAINYPKILGYGASKYVSDCLGRKTNLLLSESGGDNLITIHRPSFIGPSRKDPTVNNPHDWFSIFIKEIIRHKITCDSDYFRNSFDMTSVDFCSSMIVSVLKNQRKECLQKEKIFEYSLKNISLSEISGFLEELVVGLKLKVVVGYEEYIRQIRDRVSENVKKESCDPETNMILPFLNMMEQNSSLLDQFKVAAVEAGPNKDLLEFLDSSMVSMDVKYSKEDLNVFLSSLWNSIQKDQKIFN